MTLNGLARNERIRGIDMRPATRQLVAVTNLRRLYTVSISERTATAIGSIEFSPALTGTQFGFDFNPTVDRIRLTSDSRQNLRLNPDAAAVTIDKPLLYKVGDPSAGVSPQVGGSAYTNDVAGATTTTLYGVDVRRDVLALQDPPNDGVLTTVGRLGVDLEVRWALTSPPATAARTSWPPVPDASATGCFASA